MYNVFCSVLYNIYYIIYVMYGRVNKSDKVHLNFRTVKIVVQNSLNNSGQYCVYHTIIVIIYYSLTCVTFLMFTNYMN